MSYSKSFFYRYGKNIVSIMVLSSCLFFSIPGFSAEKMPLMRFPDIHENIVVFVYGEDIWKVPVTGGVAVRLTIHDGQERFPKLSPDGQLIAFTGQYDGNADVYIMNIHGGGITRVTYHPGFDEVVGWHPVKNKIMFRSNRKSWSRFDRLFLIDPDGTNLEVLILHEAVQGSFSADGKKIAYNKLSRENRTWKRYKGGTAQEVYVYDLVADSETNITNFEGTDRIPMWIGDKVYFSSDRDRVLNIYSYDFSSKQTAQLTNHTEYDVRRPSMGSGKIVYELGGSLWVLDVNSKTTKQIPVEIFTDAPELRPYFKLVSGNITGIDISPSGKRALIAARGELFSVPKKDGPTRNLTNSSGARDKNSVWSPDGKTIACFSDKNGEYQLYLIDPLGSKEAVCLTNFKDGYRHTLRWSPDSKKIAFTDQTLTCYYLDVASKKITKVDKAEYENIDVAMDVKPIFDFAWSSDSRYITYSKMNADLIYQVYIYALETGKIHQVSNKIFNDFNPVFSQDGKHLFFISNRRFDPTFCDFEWEMVYKKVAGIISLSLQKDGDSILPFKSDEEAVKEEKEKPAGNGDPDKKEEPGNNIVINFEGIADRVEMLPLPRGNYRNLAVNESALFFMDKDEGDFNRFEFRVPATMDLHSFTFTEGKEKTVINGINSYKLSADGKSIVYKKNNEVGIIKSSSSDSPGEKIDLAGLKMWFEPKAEWLQIFNEAWRLERDFYYDPNMHGVNWQAMKEKYGKLMASASCRQDVQFIIGELIGELNTSHTYVFGGDVRRRAGRGNIGMLGVDWLVDKKNKRYRFDKIYNVPDWTQNSEPPLAKPGVNIKEGDYLLQVNGTDVTTGKNLYYYFQDLAGKQITLLTNSKPGLAGAKKVIVKPAGGEGSFRYQTWMEHNRLICEQESGGQIGYLHLPDTFLGSTVEFPKYFYSQTRKKGLIIDGRFNAGGLDPDIFFQRLYKQIHSYWTRRYSFDQTSPSIATNAHLVCLTNRQAGSGGDMVPMEFKAKKMGPVIGTRTWGGLVGVSMFINLIDGGGLSAPDYRIYNPKGQWVVENEGVQPDIVIDLTAKEMAQGYDAQLMKGIEVLMKKIKEDPRPWPKHEAFQKDVK